MTLSEIETILLELTARHQNLTEELLTTLLVSAGWEDKIIKEAVVLFRQQQSSKPMIKSQVEQPQPQTAILSEVQNSTSPQVSPTASIEAITFYQPDGTEEGKLHAFTDIPVVKEEVKRVQTKIEPALSEQVKPAIPEPSPEASSRAVSVETPIEQVVKVEEPKVVTPPVEQIKSEVVATPYIIPTTEPQSLIIHDEVEEKKVNEKNVPLPGNLPLLPFESSPHVWSFDKYKDVFHGDAPVKEEIKVITVMPEEQKVAPLQSSTPTISVQTVQSEPVRKIAQPVKDNEVIIESVPLRKDDKPLVFLATTMLLAIILILGYMYSNGRL